MSTCDVIVGVVIGAWIAGLIDADGYGRRLGQDFARWRKERKS